MRVAVTRAVPCRCREWFVGWLSQQETTTCQRRYAGNSPPSALLGSAVAAPVLSMVSWNIDGTECTLNRHLRLLTFARRAEAIADTLVATGADLLLVQRSTTGFASDVMRSRHGSSYQWIDNLETSIPPFGNLQAFRRTGSLWEAHVALNLPFLTLNLRHAVHTQCRYLIANIDFSLSGAQPPRVALERTVDFMSDAAKVDVMAGLTNLRHTEGIGHFTDCWVQCGSPAAHNASTSMHVPPSRNPERPLRETTPPLPGRTVLPYLAGLGPNDVYWRRRDARILHRTSLGIVCTQFAVLRPSLTVDASVTTKPALLLPVKDTETVGSSAPPVAVESPPVGSMVIALSESFPISAVLEFPPPSL